MLSRFWRLSVVGVVRTSLALDCGTGMVSDGFQAQKRGSWIPGEERAQRVLASAICVDGRKEWTCKFCSESNVWTRWRYRRCLNGIPAGLRGKYRQAVAARSGEWSTGSTTSSGQKDRKSGSRDQGTPSKDWCLGKEGREGVQGGQCTPSRKAGDLEDVWEEDMDIEDETENVKNG